VLWLDGLVWGSRSGRRVPSSSDDVFVAPERAEVLRRHAALGTRLLGLTWQPEVEAGAIALDTLEASLARLRDLLGAPLEVLHCPHVPGPPRCWCRKPLPGLGLQLVLRHRLNPARCVYVGQGGQDRLFAERLGFAFQDAADFFATGAAAPAASRLGSNPGGDP
jgi:histidinol phosphatase-like enzyme